jgi:leader peptidase (prepilin peptidase)/N-methyltransferase
MAHAMVIVFLFALGTCVGSFLNVVIYRLPRNKSIAFPGSHCPKCGNPIGWYDNIPILSWLILRGKCRFCKVAISPRYLIVELVTGLLVTGLYVWYFMLGFRQGAVSLGADWPMFLAHAVLWCSLLACSAIDIEHWIIPLEVCWFASAVGIVVAAAAPSESTLLSPVGPQLGMIGLAAAVGLVISLVLQHRGVLQPSFIDAAETIRCEGGSDSPGQERIVAVAAGSEHGINPRKEILREVLYLLPAGVLAGAMALTLRFCPAVNAWVSSLTDPAQVGRWAPHIAGFQAALLGYLIGGLWIWGTRILGTLGFGKEAMGLGDVHLLAAVGAVTGWVVPSLAFFIAPFFGLLWAIRLMCSRRAREMPYGPHLALAAMLTMLFYDDILSFIRPLLGGSY